MKISNPQGIFPGGALSGLLVWGMFQALEGVTPSWV